MPPVKLVKFGSIAATWTLRFENGVLMLVLCVPLPFVVVTTNPWLSNAPISGVPPSGLRNAALVGGNPGNRHADI